jgi:hypothetical protein
VSRNKCAIAGSPAAEWARRSGQKVDAIQTEVVAQRLDVGDLPVTAIRRRVGGDAGLAGAAQVEQDQAAVSRRPAGSPR